MEHDRPALIKREKTVGERDHKAATTVWEVKQAEWRGF